MEFDADTTERAFRSDAFRKEIGWGPRELQLALDHADGFDATFGTNTSGVDFETPPGSYVPILPRMFRSMMAGLTIRPEELTFVDIGSGKGRALLLASEYPFKRCIGVELAAEHHAVALENVEIYRRGPALQASPIELVHSDATTYAFPNEDLFIHFFHSFPAEVLRKMLATLERSLALHPRRIGVLYSQPHNGSVWTESGTWKLHGPQGAPCSIPLIVKDGAFPWAFYANF